VKQRTVNSGMLLYVSGFKRLQLCEKFFSYTLSVLNVKGYFNFLRLYDIIKTFMSPQLEAHQCKQYNS